MKKSILALFAMVILVATSGYAQETATGDDSKASRTISVYVDSSTGHLTQDPNFDNPNYASSGIPRTFTDNCVEIGVVFNQVFESGVGYSVSLVADGSFQVDWNDKSEEGDGSDYVSSGEGFLIEDLPYISAGITYGIAGFSTYATFNTDLVFEVGVDYTHSFGGAGSLGVGSTVCLDAKNVEYVTSNRRIGYDIRDVESEESTYKVNYLNLFQVYLGYDITFHPKWNYSTVAKVRFDGDGSVYEFAESLYIRWENRFTYLATDNFSFYGQLRYQVNGLIDPNSAYHEYYGLESIDHKVSLQFGVSYRFDL